jgi:hypothetical protein
LEGNFEVISLLTHLVGICFEQREIPECILLPFSVLVVEDLLAKHAEAVFAWDEPTLRRIISSFTGESSLLHLFIIVKVANLSSSAQ